MTRGFSDVVVALRQQNSRYFVMWSKESPSVTVKIASKIRLDNFLTILTSSSKSVQVRYFVKLSEGHSI